MLIKLEDVVDLPTEPYHPQRIQQLAVQCKAQRCYESQSRQLKNEGEKIFSACHGQIAATHTASASGCTTQKMLPTGLLTQPPYIIVCRPTMKAALWFFSDAKNGCQ